LARIASDTRAVIKPKRVSGIEDSDLALTVSTSRIEAKDNKMKGMPPQG